MSQILTVSSVLASIGSILVALLILLAMITIHEFGHYIAGKLLKFKINEFSIGFGPAIFKKKNEKTGEQFSVRVIPLGGYCAFDGEEEETESETSFVKQKPWKRIIVLVAGAFMNYVLAMILILTSFFAYGQYLYVTYEVEPSETAAVYSFHDKDIIYECEGRDVYLVSDIVKGIRGKSEGDLVEFTVSRLEGEERKVQKVEIMLRADTTSLNSASNDEIWTALGIAKNDEGAWQMFVTPTRLGFFETIGRSFVYSFRVAGSIFQALGELITGAIGLNAMGGPITTITMTSQIATRSFRSFLEISSYIGVNLAVFNLLPIPALDGSKVIFTAIEWVRGKPVNRKVEAIIHTVGLLLIFGFAILVDILQWL